MGIFKKIKKGVKQGAKNVGQNLKPLTRPRGTAKRVVRGVKSAGRAGYTAGKGAVKNSPVGGIIRTTRALKRSKRGRQ